MVRVEFSVFGFQLVGIGGGWRGMAGFNRGARRARREYQRLTIDGWRTGKRTAEGTEVPEDLGVRGLRLLLDGEYWRVLVAFTWSD